MTIEADTIPESIEDSAIRNLAGLSETCDGGYFQTLAPYNGSPTPDREDPDFQRATQGGIPACLVMVGDAEYENRTMGGRVADLEMELLILIASCNLRNPEARNRGDLSSQDPGIYQMIKDIRGLLYNVPLEGVFGACRARPILQGAVLRGRDRTVWLLTYAFNTDVVEERLDADDPKLIAISNKLGFSQEENPGAPDNVTEFDVDFTP